MSWPADIGKRITDTLEDMIAASQSRGKETPTIGQYLQACAKHGVIDHAIRSSDGVNFYIHPAGVDGPTIDFLSTGFNLVHTLTKWRHVPHDEYGARLPD